MQDGRVPQAKEVGSLFLLGEAEALVFSLAPISTHSLSPEPKTSLTSGRGGVWVAHYLLKARTVSPQR